MPTLKENIRYELSRVDEGYLKTAWHYAKVLVAVLLVACVLELTVFNINFYTSAFYTETDLSDRLQLPTDEEGVWLLTENNSTIEISSVDEEVHNICIDLTKNQDAQELSFKINFTDDAHQTFFETTEYTIGIPEADVSTYAEKSKVINISANGKVKALRIQLDATSNTHYPIRLSSLRMNVQRPFDFNANRLLIAYLVLLLAYMFRPKSSLYRIQLKSHPRFTRAAISVALCVELVISGAYLLYGSNQVGIATASYNYGSWDGSSAVSTYQVGGENAQQYAELARSMVEGHLYLDEEPPAWLSKLENPYDKGVRDEYSKRTGETCLHDVAYKDGKYYVYFGVVPVLLFYLPFLLLTGQDFPTALGVLLAAWAFIVGCTLLLDRFARKHFERVSLGIFLLLQIPLVVCSGFPYLLKFPTFYSLPIACALACTVWGVYFWMKGRASSRPVGWYLAGSLCMALTLGCRPQFLALSLLAFPLFWRPYVKERRIASRSGAIEFACLIAPYLVVGLLLMWYNAARFGSPFDFGANYNLTLNDMTKRGMDVGRLLPAVFAYFLQPPSATGVFPFLQAVPFDTTYMGQTVKEATFGGLFACVPLLWVLPFAVQLAKKRAGQRSTRTILGVVAVLIGYGIVVALLDAEVAGILQRYFADFSFPFVMAAVLLVLIANENIKQKSALRTNLGKVLIALSAASVLYVVALCFVPETGWYSDVYPWSYQSLIDMVLFWT